MESLFAERRPKGAASWFVQHQVPEHAIFVD